MSIVGRDDAGERRLLDGQAVLDGCIHTAMDGLPLARQVMLLLDGSFAVTLLHRDPSYMKNAGEAAFSLVGAALISR